MSTILGLTRSQEMVEWQPSFPPCLQWSRAETRFSTENNLALSTGDSGRAPRFLCQFWRRGELNPRPRSLATRRLHA